MALAYSLDLRKKIIEKIDNGMSITEASQIFDLGRNTIHRWINQRNLQGTLAPKTNWQKGHGHKIKDLDYFKKFAEENKDLTAKDMAKKWNNISAKTIRKWLRRIGYTKKKDFWI